MVQDIANSNKIDGSAAACSADKLAKRGAKKNEQVAGDQFLQIFMTQLKTDASSNTAGGTEFAVNLAQFSQLEQLVSGTGKNVAGGSDMASLAGYLGREVLLPDGKVHTEGGAGGRLQVSLPTDAEALEVQLLDAQGTVADVVKFGKVAQGTHMLDLGKTNTGTGDYSFNVVAQRPGGSMEVNAQAAGLVTGFIPGSDPRLIVNGKETAPGSVKEVTPLLSRAVS